MWGVWKRCRLGLIRWNRRPFGSILAPMAKLLGVLAAVGLLAGGAALAVASGGGGHHHWNAGHKQYKPKPGCGPWKSHGWAGKSGWHFGQPPKRSFRRDCPKPPCKRRWHSRFSALTGGSYYHRGRDCRDKCDPYRRFSGFTGRRHRRDDDCDDGYRRRSQGASSGAPTAVAA